MQQLRTNNTRLHTHIQDLNMQHTTLQAELDNAKTQLTEIRSAPHRQTLCKVWHQRAKNIIGTDHSRITPSHAYECAYAQNGGYNWYKKG